MRLTDELGAASTQLNSHRTNSPESFDNNHEMTQILTYALPLSCTVIFAVFLIFVAVYRRRHVLDKWNSLTRMKNTDPRFHARAGLRRDSEYESSTEDSVTVTTINEEDTIPKESDYRIATIA